MIKNKNARKLTLAETKELVAFSDENARHMTIFNKDGDFSFLSYDLQAVLDLYHASCHYDCVDSWLEEVNETVTDAALVKIQSRFLKRI
ncbi:hypothetical protein UFOVP75_38 [uncultured Caudovirales phage]|uniref:Uncharacterized protein n=1 Tax=uncultured Caudovirales phage TaxID=2100421 RepID=A0A6J5L0P6_9CAUD|nr:hypothetical protein UFOVP75_38 [uncultured Caudovirales phage]